MVVFVLSSPPTSLYSTPFFVLLLVCAFFALCFFETPSVRFAPGRLSGRLFLTFSLFFLGSMLLAFRLFALPPFSSCHPPPYEFSFSYPITALCQSCLPRNLYYDLFIASLSLHAPSKARTRESATQRSSNHLRDIHFPPLPALFLLSLLSFDAQPRWTIVGLAWHVGKTNSSATWTCAGRRATQTISSAMSSATTVTPQSNQTNVSTACDPEQGGRGRREERGRKGRTRLKPIIDLISLALVAPEPSDREVCLDHPGLNFGNFEGRVDELLHEGG